MIKNLFILSTLTYMAECGVIGFDKVHFIPPATSFAHFSASFGGQRWNHHVPGNEIDHHITPDFSDGLAYPDPFLRTGIQAKQLADYLYSKEFFFDQIPHVRGVLHNNEQRVKNGLAPHRTGSLRSSSPWYRYPLDEVSNGIHDYHF